MDTHRLSKHSVQNLVVSCIDFRFNNDMYDAIKNSFAIDEFDEIKLAGGAGNLALLGNTREERKETVLADLELAIRAHQVTHIYLLTHHNCGAYALSGHAFPKELSIDEREFHAAELQAARELIKEKFPDVHVHVGFVAVKPENILEIISY